MDTLLFKKITLDIHGSEGIGAQIFINGSALMDRVSDVECAYNKKNGLNPPLGYEHQIAKNLYDQLVGKCEVDDGFGVAVLTCTCFVDGCDSIRAEIIETQDEVVWHLFQHRCYDFDEPKYGEFHFIKEQYKKEIEKLYEFI